MKRHPVDSVALVFALLFSAALVWWAVAKVTNDLLHIPAAWIGAGTLLVVGLVGLVSALRPQPQADAPLTVVPEPQPALQVVSDPYADLYADPYFHASTMNVGEGVLDPETVAAAYREAGFSDTDHFPTATIPTTPPTPQSASPSASPSPSPSATDEFAADDRPTVEVHPAETETTNPLVAAAPPGNAEESPPVNAKEEAQPTLVDPLRPADRDSGPPS